MTDDEAVAADYRDRGGYQADFLGKGKLEVDLPSVERDADDVLDFEVNGKAETELRYEHYSVVMSRSRRMCFFSAVNIDGNLSKKSTRVGWKWDPRIPKAQQIMNECYGTPPKFSRGHMTRREDPGWGRRERRPSAATRTRCTSPTPRRRCRRSTRRSGLRSRTMRSATRGKTTMKISVFTGPYFDRQRSGDVWRADPARLLEDHRLHS